MTVTLTLARPDDLDRLDRMLAAVQAERGHSPDPAPRRAGLDALLAGTPHGVVYLIGPPKSPVGFVVVSFGWSLERGEIAATVSEMYIRDGVRGRGMGTEALTQILTALGRHGVTALRCVVPADEARPARFFRRLGFSPQTGRTLMSRPD